MIHRSNCLRDHYSRYINRNTLQYICMQFHNAVQSLSFGWAHLLLVFLSVYFVLPLFTFRIVYIVHVTTISRQRQQQPQPIDSIKTSCQIDSTIWITSKTSKSQVIYQDCFQFGNSWHSILCREKLRQKKLYWKIVVVVVAIRYFFAIGRFGCSK